MCSTNRVKLPKSFLAVNLSESHTFHKKEETEENQVGNEQDMDVPATTTVAAKTGEDHQPREEEVRAHEHQRRKDENDANGEAVQTGTITTPPGKGDRSRS